MKKFLIATLIMSIFMACNSNDISVEKKELAKIEMAEREVTHRVIIKGEEELTEQTIRVAATSDVHGRIYPYDYAIGSKDTDAGLAKVSTIVNALREENPSMILMDDGDTVQDNSSELFNDLEVHPMVEAMNSIGYDIWTLGNHEFNFEKEFIERNISNFNGTVLSANIKNKKDGSDYVNPYQIFSVNGARVAIIGITPPYVPMWESSSPSHFKGLEFNKILKSVQETVKKLDGQYDLLIGSFHMGREDEYGGAGIYDIANKIPEFDVIFGGHEHAKYIENINNTPIVEPGFAGWAVSKADIRIKKEAKKWIIKGIEVENIQTKTIKSDQKILDEFKYVDDQAKVVAGTVIGEISETFIARPDFITGEDKVTTMPTAQLQPNAVIDLINDVQLKYAGADVSSAAFFKAEANLRAGNFQNKDVANIYKYANTLVGVNMTGKNLIEFMEWSMSYYNTWNEGDVTISFNKDIRGYNYDMFAGVNYKVDLSKDAGNRVVDPTINGEVIDPTKTYKVAVNNYRFGTLTKKGWVTPEDKYYDSYETMQDAGRIRDLIIKYTKEEKNGELNPIVHNNWKIIGVKLDYPERDAIYEMIKRGEIVIPGSADGRTLNIKSINLKDYVEEEEMKSYTVKKGDILVDIANNFNLKISEILKENKNLKNADIIRIGEELIIPVK
jgi:2',3'-cyclic-nucleotide 2'-phosphodiesterase (5'-nucleotidase family)